MDIWILNTILSRLPLYSTIIAAQAVPTTDTIIILLQHDDQSIIVLFT